MIVTSDRRLQARVMSGPDLPREPDRQTSRYWLSVGIVTVIASGARLAFWFATRWTIEDALIIARMARNLAVSGELTFNVGQRISASTSPLFALTTGEIARAGIDPVTAAKLLGVFCSALTCAIMLDVLLQFLETEAAIVGALFYALLPPAVAYSVGGMETPVYTAACCITLERLLRGRDTQGAFWASAAALLRPDGAIMLLVAIGVIGWRRRRAPATIVATLWPMATLLPAGFFAHWAYYGHPIPQSLIAKQVGYTIDPLSNASRYLNRMLFAQPAGLVIYVCALIGAWCASRERRLHGLSIFAAWYVLYHLFFFARAPLFDWYLQPPLFVLCLFAAIGLWASVDLIGARFNRGEDMFWRRAVGACAVVMLSAGVVRYADGRRENQQFETEVRGAASGWLSRHSPQNALVFTESLGYVAYGTPNPFVDWPGLASPGIPELLISTRTAQSRRLGYDTIISRYEPKYLVLRNTEWAGLDPALKLQYRACAHFLPPNAKDNVYLIAAHECP